MRLGRYCWFLIYGTKTTKKVTRLAEPRDGCLDNVKYAAPAEEPPPFVFRSALCTPKVTKDEKMAVKRKEKGIKVDKRD